MITHLLDTNICIELIRGRSEGVLNHLRRHKIGQIAVSTITVAELEYDVVRSSDPARNKIALVEFCSPLELLAFDDNAAAVYGQIRAQLEQAGKPIGPLDTLIAAHALSVNATLVTNNLREFKRVPELKLVNWA